MASPLRASAPPFALLSALAASSLGACSWQRFDEALEAPPVQLLDRPSFLSGDFGSVLAAGRGSGGPALLAGGLSLQSTAALIPLDPTSGAPSGPAVAACADARTCRQLRSAAALPDTPSRRGCFLHGVGPGAPPLDATLGLLIDCVQGAPSKRAVPAEVSSSLLPRVFSPTDAPAFQGIFAVASSGDLLAVGAPDLSVAWAYESEGSPPVPIAAPASVGSFGVAVAAIASNKGSLVAVAAPSVGTVYVFDVSKGSSTLRGCIRRPAPYGVVLHGFVDGTRRLLATSDGAFVVDVLDVDTLPPRVGAAEPPCVEAVSHPLVASPRCSVTDGAQGCNGASFGYALASGDLDGDGDQELVVGAPGFNKGRLVNTGAVQLFDLEGSNSPAQTLSLSSAEVGDQLGTQVTTVRVGSRDVVVSNAFTKQKLVMFTCARLDPLAPPCP